MEVSDVSLHNQIQTRISQVSRFNAHKKCDIYGNLSSCATELTQSIIAVYMLVSSTTLEVFCPLNSTCDLHNLLTRNLLPLLLIKLMLLL